MSENTVFNLFECYYADINITLLKEGITELVFEDKLKIKFCGDGITVDNSSCSISLGYIKNGEQAVRFIPVSCNNYKIKVVVDAFSVELFINDGKWPISTIIDKKEVLKLTANTKNSTISIKAKQII